MNSETIPAVPSQASKQGVAPFQVHAAHAAQMAGKVTFPQKLGECKLVQRGRKEIERFPRLHELLPKRRWHNEVPYPHSGEEHFAERADVDDPLVRIHPLERA